MTFDIPRSSASADDSMIFRANSFTLAADLGGGIRTVISFPLTTLEG